MADSRADTDELDSMDVPSEMEIVDTFTRLIFGEEEFAPQELAIVQVLRLVDDNIALDDFTEMGRYLRALGVPEMIALVGRVRDCMEDTGGPAALGLDFPPPHGLRRH